MTDEQIIKALECCINAETWGDCEEMGCPASTKHGCSFYLRTDDDRENTIYIEILKDALDLINRQKAEIEELREIVFTDRSEAIKKLKSEAIKEFAERLKVRLDRKFTVYGREYVLRHLRELVKEMVGEQ